jgi:hypothetical protein
MVRSPPVASALLPVVVDPLLLQAAATRTIVAARTAKGLRKRSLREGWWCVSLADPRPDQFVRRTGSVTNV